jgi:hypothetical protein
MAIRPFGVHGEGYPVQSPECAAAQYPPNSDSDRVINGRDRYACPAMIAGRVPTHCFNYFKFDVLTLAQQMDSQSKRAGYAP